MTDLSRPSDYPQSHDLLAGRNVLVTAAAGTGIGYAAARRCLEEGARVLISDIHAKRLAESVDRLEETTDVRPASTLCNVTVQAEVNALFDTARNSFESIDVVINNAGLGGTANLMDMTDDQWTAVLDVTLNGTFRMTRAAMQAMRESGGVIVNNASVLGWRAQKGQAHYAAAKAGVMALTRCAALEGAEFGIRVNAVAPSLAMHPFLSRAIPLEQLQELETREAYGRSAEVWEVANVMVFLASEYSTYMTGETVSVSSQRA